jgi:hypothetical protein
MRTLNFAAFLLLASTQSGLADDCADRIAQFVIGSVDSVPAEGHIISEIKGQPKTENDFVTVSWKHYLYKPTVPAGGPWLLTYDGTTYQSADEGESWKKLYSFNLEDTRAASIKTVTEQASTIRNAACGEEALDGVVHDVLEADMTNLAPQTFEIHSKYWINRDTGFVAKAATLVKSDSFESSTIQTWRLADGLTLPIPE